MSHESSYYENISVMTMTGPMCFLKHELADEHVDVSQDIQNICKLLCINGHKVVDTMIEITQEENVAIS